MGINNCKYYDNGNCKVFGDKIIISCATVSNMTPEACKSGNRGGKRRKNNKRSNNDYS